MIEYGMIDVRKDGGLDYAIAQRKTDITQIKRETLSRPEIKISESFSLYPSDVNVLYKDTQTMYSFSQSLDDDIIAWFKLRAIGGGNG